MQTPICSEDLTAVWRHMQGRNQKLCSRKPLSIEPARSRSLAAWLNPVLPSVRWWWLLCPHSGQARVTADLPPAPSAQPVLLSRRCCPVSSPGPCSEPLTARGPWCPGRAGGKCWVKGMCVPPSWAGGCGVGWPGGSCSRDGQVGRRWLIIVS